MSDAPTRPVMRYHGGKWKLAPWIISHLPPHRVYVEPFGGAASVLLRKPRSHGEVFNDLCCDVVNVFRVLQDPARAAELHTLLSLTPYSRAEFELAYEQADCEILQACRMIIRSFMGFGSPSAMAEHSTGFRSNASRNGTTPAQDWAHWPEQVPLFVQRLRGVCIENRDALQVMAQHDSAATLHYCDPPYVHSSRKGLHSGGKQLRYNHEMTDEEHLCLGAFLRGLRGMVVVSGYRCDLYDEMFSDWHLIEKHTFADGASPRIECLWVNQAGYRRQAQLGLLDRLVVQGMTE